MNFNFIETLKSVGGVKPCSVCAKAESSTMFVVGPTLGAKVSCPSCHGTGQILDLAPLLARPLYLKDEAFALKEKFAESMAKLTPGVCRDFGTPENRANCMIWEALTHQFNPYVVGPQRASNLVYEVARQLSGTAVVTEPVYDDGDATSINPNRRNFEGVRLSLPVPSGSNVLFVTDKADKKEMREVIGCVDQRRLLPYILCLVSCDASELSVDGTEPWIMDSNEFKVISLHQEYKNKKSKT